MNLNMYFRVKYLDTETQIRTEAEFKRVQPVSNVLLYLNRIRINPNQHQTGVLYKSKPKPIGHPNTHAIIKLYLFWFGSVCILTVFGLFTKNLYYIYIYTYYNIL